MEISIKKSALTKTVTRVLVALLLVSSMILLTACGGKETDTPMSLSGKTMVSDFSKTEFNWVEGTDEKIKNDITTNIANSEPLIMIFNTDGSATFDGANFYYTQEGSALKLYSDANKTTEFDFGPEVKIESAVGSDFLKMKFMTVGDLGENPIVDYSLYFYAQA